MTASGPRRPRRSYQLSSVFSIAKRFPRCADIATSYPTSNAKSDRGRSPWKRLQSITSALVPPSGPNAAYCRVELKYLREINIRVGLPLNPADGGTGGVQGAWNGKIQNLGGGGFAGTRGAVTGSVNDGYV